MDQDPWIFVTLFCLACVPEPVNLRQNFNVATSSVVDPDPDPWNPYHFPRSDPNKKNRWIWNPDPYQIIRIRIQLKP